jgi:hypothetical protein
MIPRKTIGRKNSAHKLIRAHFRLGAKMGKLAATGLGESPCPAHALK